MNLIPVAGSLLSAWEYSSDPDAGVNYNLPADKTCGQVPF